MRYIKRGDIYTADLSPVTGSEQGGTRPVLIIQNDIGNKHSPTVIVGVITTRNKSRIPTHVHLGQAFGLPKQSILLLEQVRTIDKLRLKEKIGEITDDEILEQINQAIRISFGLI